jgi:hypothetical protein
MDGGSVACPCSFECWPYYLVYVNGWGFYLQGLTIANGACRYFMQQG